MPEVIVRIDCWDDSDAHSIERDIGNEIRELVENLGYTWSEYHDCYIADNEVCYIADEVRHQSECSECDTCGESFLMDDREDEYCSDECIPSSINSYHSERRVIHKCNEEAPWLIGMEVEKEDQDVREDNPEAQEGWILEEDGSLDDDSGFELVSPAYNLSDAETIIRGINSNQDLIDADSSLDCGGHITLSHYGLTGEQTLEKMRSLVPLLMSLYPYRLNNQYCKEATCKSDTLASKDKYRAFRVDDNKVECRLISRVRDCEQLKWRVSLIRYVLQSELSIVDTYKSLRSGKLRELLRERYTSESDIDRVCSRFAHFSIYFHTGKVASKIETFIPKK